MNKPILITSLDFELFWGMQDGWKLEDYQENILGGRKAIPKLLKLFQKHGMLFSRHETGTWRIDGVQMSFLFQIG